MKFLKLYDNNQFNINVDELITFRNILLTNINNKFDKHNLNKIRLLFVTKTTFTESNIQILYKFFNINVLHVIKDVLKDLNIDNDAWFITPNGDDINISFRMSNDKIKQHIQIKKYNL